MIVLDAAIKVENLTVRYSLIDKSMFKNKLFFLGNRSARKRDHIALNNISFSVNKGEVLGVIGSNGAGKSTLLKVLSRIIAPDSGLVQTDGKVSALLTLGSGFNAELTGEENIYLNGLFLGMTKKQIDEKLDNIIEFADIGEFIHQPLRTYSSGMKARLGFSVAVFADPEILLIDEVLGVGDQDFRNKCRKEIYKKIRSKKTVVVVSHDLNTIIRLCRKVLWLEKGHIKAFGDIDEVMEMYHGSE